MYIIVNIYIIFHYAYVSYRYLSQFLWLDLQWKKRKNDVDESRLFNYLEKGVISKARIRAARPMKNT